MLDRGGEGVINRFLHLPISGHPTIRLIGFPHAGGATSAYFAMSRRFPPDWDVMFFEYPGRGRRSRESLVASFGAVVERLELREIDSSRVLARLSC